MGEETTGPMLARDVWLDGDFVLVLSLISLILHTPVRIQRGAVENPPRPQFSEALDVGLDGVELEVAQVVKRAKDLVLGQAIPAHDDHVALIGHSRLQMQHRTRTDRSASELPGPLEQGRDIANERARSCHGRLRARWRRELAHRVQQLSRSIRRGSCKVHLSGGRPAHLISCEIISEAGRSAISCHLRLSFWNGVLALRASGGTIQPAFDAVRVIHVCTVESPPPSCCRDLVEADDTHNPAGLGGLPLLESIFEQQGVHLARKSIARDARAADGFGR